MSLHRTVVLVAVLLCVGWVFGGALSNDFVWDDHVLFVDNPALRSGPVTWETVSRPVMDGSVYLRPLVLLTWVLEYRLWGVNAEAAHAVNLVFHLLNVALVFLFALHVLGVDERQKTVRAALAALLYALHPALAEVVAWVSGRFDLMVTTFMLAALLADAWLVSRFARALVLSVLFALALACKELALMLPPILLVIRLVREMQGCGTRPTLRGAFAIVRNDLPTVIGMAAVFGGWVLLRIDALGVVFLDSRIAPAMPPGTLFYTHVLLILNTLWFYVLEIVLPFARVSPLHPLDFPLLTEPLGLMRAMGGLATIGACAACVVRRPIQGLLLAAALLGLLPVLQVVPLTSTANSIGSDRFLTLPLVFIAIAIATVGFPFTQKLSGRVQKLGASLAGATWLVLCVAAITVTIPLWRDEWTLWSWAYQSHPESEFAERAYIHAAMRRGEYDLAKAVFDKLRARGPLHSFVQVQYGMYLVRVGDKDEAEKYIQGGMLAYGIAPGGASIPGRPAITTISDRLIVGYGYYALSEIEQMRGNFSKALEYMDKAVHYLPQASIYLAVRAVLLIANNRVDEGERLYADALQKVAPQHRDIVEQVRQKFLSDLCSKHQQLSLSICAMQAQPSSAPAPR